MEIDQDTKRGFLLCRTCLTEFKPHYSKEITFKPISEVTFKGNTTSRISWIDRNNKFCKDINNFRSEVEKTHGRGSYSTEQKCTFDIPQVVHTPYSSFSAKVSK